MRRGRTASVLVLAAAGALAMLGSAPATASSVPLAGLVGQAPVSWTPNVSAGPTVGAPACNQTYFGSGNLKCLSEVYGTAYVNGDVVVAGAFTEACQPGKLSQGLCAPGTQVTRNDIFAYQASTGVIDPDFAPQLDAGPAWTVIPGPAGSNTVYVGGAFRTVNGAAHHGLVQLNVSPGVTTGPAADGSVVTAFKASVSNFVQDLALSPDGAALYAGGQFGSADSTPATALARFNATTGAIDTAFHVTLSTPISGLPLKIESMSLTKDGSLLAISSTALQVNGQSRPRLAVIVTGGALGSAPALADFAAPILSNNCSAAHDYVRAVSFAPDGSYLAIATTGFLSDGSTPFSVCDAAARFTVGAAGAAATGTPVQVAPSWINYTGGDSFYSIVVAGNVIYAGGHQRWVNNGCGSNSVCAPNAELVNGLAAMDANTGIGIAWWHPQTLRGHGTLYLDTFAPGTYDGSRAGLAVGTDVDVVAGAYHAENALLPLIGTAAPPAGPIPSGLFDTEGGSNTNQPLCLDDQGNGTASGTPAVIAPCQNTTDQVFGVPAAGGTGTITVNGLCLATAGAGTAPGTKAELDTCDSTAATQQWSQGTGNAVVNQGASVADGTPMCLDDPAASTSTGTQLDIAACTASAQQAWPLPAAPGPPSPTPPGPVFPQLLQKSTQVPCLDDANNSTGADNKVQLWGCRGDAQQNWTAGTDGTFRLQGSYCLDTAGGGTSQGTAVVLNQCNGTGSQVWIRGPKNSLVQQASGLCLDDPASNTVNGTAMDIWTCNGGNNQAWRLP
jgi:Ricin-type beta-trefoil lectin domain/Domain of unknown function (DUF5122) beta-propeller